MLNSGLILPDGFLLSSEKNNHERVIAPMRSMGPRGLKVNPMSLEISA
jgi:hypothetical protein